MMSFNEKLHTLGPDVRAMILKYLDPSTCYFLFRAPQLKRKFNVYELASSDPKLLSLCPNQGIEIPQDLISKTVGWMNLQQINQFHLSNKNPLDSSWYYGAAKRGDFWVVKWLYHHKKVPINGTVIQSCVAGCQKEMIKYFSKMESILFLFINKYNPMWCNCLNEMMKKPQVCEFLTWLLDESPLLNVVRRYSDYIATIACDNNQFDVLNWLLERQYSRSGILSRAKGNAIVTEWLLKK